MQLLSFIGNLDDYLIPCLSKKLFGVECMGCGFQRGLIDLLRGEFVAAFKMYPGIYPIVALVVFSVLHYFYKFKKGAKIIRYLAILTICTIVISYFIKMTL